MASTSFVIGGTVYITLEAKKLAKVFTVPPEYDYYDLTQGSLVLKPPSGAEIVYGPGDLNWHKPTLAPDDVGKYYVVLKLNQAGPWEWKWVDGDPDEPGLLTGKFTMKEPPF